MMRRANISMRLGILWGIEAERKEENEGKRGSSKKEEEEISKILHLSGGVFSGAGIMRVQITFPPSPLGLPAAG